MAGLLLKRGTGGPYSPAKAASGDGNLGTGLQNFSAPSSVNRGYCSRANAINSWNRRHGRRLSRKRL
jgi:hypothetical protein